MLEFRTIVRMSTYRENEVLTGFWYYLDSDHGVLVWTMKRQYWRYFTNFLVIFTAFSFERLWFLIGYVIYQRGSHNKPRDGLRRSTEILIRNFSNRGFISQYIFVLFYWRRRRITSNRSQLISILIFLLAVLVFLSGQITAIFLQPSSDDGRVAMLKAHQGCGIYYSSTPQGFDSLVSSAMKEIEPLYQFYADFVASRPIIEPPPGFYIPLVSPDSLIGPSLTAFKTNCPFHPDICRYKEGIVGMDQEAYRPMIMDTGFLSSRDVGVNTEEQVTLRRVDVCAPLDTKNEKYHSFDQFSPEGPGNQTDGFIHGYMYGPISGREAESSWESQRSTNLTYKYAGSFKSLQRMTVW